MSRIINKPPLYENFWNTLNTQLNNLNSASYGNPVRYKYAAFTKLYIYTRQFSNVEFQSLPTVQFYGNRIFREYQD